MYYNACRDNEIADVIDEHFTTREERLGDMVTTELKPGGADIPVTEKNKQEYVDLVVEDRNSKRFKGRTDALVGGFCELVPRGWIDLSDGRELELLISEVNVYVLPISHFQSPCWNYMIGMT